ncbi:MAG: hypothetical protein AAGF66_03780, partial [Cyanobacteria bacterium P01_H01_bin.119]
VFCLSPARENFGGAIATGSTNLHISREFRGTPNESFRQQPPAGGPSRPGSRPDAADQDRLPIRPPGGPPPR